MEQWIIETHINWAKTIYSSKTNIHVFKISKNVCEKVINSQINEAVNYWNPY